MKKYQKIANARKVLELPERASMDHIKASYRRLLMHWHPDKQKGSQEKCAEMTAKITSAYKLIMRYCSHFEFPFTEEEVRYHLSEEELFSERFNGDPVWGSGENKGGARKA